MKTKITSILEFCHYRSVSSPPLGPYLIWLFVLLVGLIDFLGLSLFIFDSSYGVSW